MLGRRTLGMYRKLGEYVRGLQEIGPADEEVGNRLLRAGDELAEVERLVRRARSKAAEAMREARGALRELGVAVPALTRPPSAASGARPSPGADSIVYSRADAGPCVACGEAVTAGPIGWGPEAESGPVCDGCLKERCGPLALVLMMAGCVREMGEMECGSEEEEHLVGSALTAMGQQVEGLFFRAWLPGPGLPDGVLIRLLEEIGEGDGSG